MAELLNFLVIFHLLVDHQQIKPSLFAKGTADRVNLLKIFYGLPVSLNMAVPPSLVVKNLVQIDIELGSGMFFIVGQAVSRSIYIIEFIVDCSR